MEETKMNTKKFLVSFLAIASVLLLVLTVSAGTSELATIDSVEVNGIDEVGNEDISVIAGETVDVEVTFESLEDASDVRIRVELEGSKVDSEKEVFVGDLESGKKYTRTLSLRVPYELQDEVSDDLALNIKVWNGDFKTEHPEVTLRVQRASYNVGVMSVSTSQTINAGETFPVDIVLKNIGYNDLDDLYATVKIPALEIQARAYFGDLVAIEVDDSDDKEGDTVRGRLFLNIPYDAVTGLYSLEVEVSNDDLNINKVKQIFVENELPQRVLKSGNDLILLNPTDKLKVYRVLAESPGSVSENTVVVPAGSSRNVLVSSSTDETFSVNVFSGENIVGSVEFTGTEATGATNAVVVLTVILAIIFIVLLVVLLVLLTKKPSQEEEFGESYY